MHRSWKIQARGHGRAVSIRFRAWLLMLALLWPGLAAAAPSIYCPVLTATVANGGTVDINVSSCDGPFDAGVGGPFVLPLHGTVTVGINNFGTQWVSYAHNGNTALSDSFTLEDENGDAITVNITITPAVSAIVVTPATLPTMTAGTPFSQALTSSGGSAPYTYSLSSGTLPAGISLTSAGVLSGTPTQRGGYSFSVRSQDALGDFVIRGYTGTVQNPALSITPTSATAVQGVAFSRTLSASGGVAPHSYLIESGSFPAGISISSSGVVSGTTAAAPASHSVILRVTDASSGPGSYFELESFTLTVSPPPTIVVTPASLPGASVAAAYSQSFTSSGGTDPYTYAISAGALPAGLALNATGALTGTPTAGGAFNFTVRATDANSFSGTRAYTLSVGAPTIALSPASLPSGAVAAAYSQSLSASGGTAPYIHAVTAGALPAGLTLSSAGVLSGTPSAGGSFNFTVTASDSSTGTGPYTGSRAYTLTIAAPTIALPATTLGNGGVGTPYSAVLNPASGGTAPYLYAVTAGALPAGLSLSSSGALSGTPSVDGSFNFTVTATDSSTGTGPYGTTQNYSLTVANVPPVAGPVSLGVAYGSAATPVTLNLSGSAASSVAVATVPAHGTAIASGTGITYQPTAGYAGADSFTYTASNSGGTSAPATVMVTVGGPTIVVNASAALSAQIGTAYTQTFTWSGGAAPYGGYAVTGLPAGLSVTGSTTDSVTVAGTPTAAGTFALNASATDSSTGNGPFTGGQAFTLAVGAPTLSLSPAAGTIPLNYGGATTLNFSASGGIGPYSYSLVSGGLPVGMSLSSAGVLSGTPTVPGSYPLGIRVTDSSTGTGAPFSLTQNYVLQVGVPTISIAPATLPDGVAGQAYAATLSASGGVGPYSFSLLSGALPIGLTFSSAGVFSGVPRADGSFALTVRATDAHGQNSTQMFTFDIAAPTLAITPATLPAGTTHIAYHQALGTSGGIAPYSYSIPAGALPIGVSFSSAGVFSGTPLVAGSHTVSIRSTDDAGFNTTLSYTIVITAPTIVVDPPTLPGASVGSAYAATLSASGGSGPYSYALIGGSLPVGTSFTSAGQLSGTPTASGTYAFTVRATDSNGNSGDRAYGLSVAAATLTISPATLPAGTAGTAYAQALTASGGIAPYRYALASGTLPAGISLGSAGALSGTPTASGTFTFGITATDSGGGTPGSVTRDYTLVIAAGTLTLDPATLPAGTAGVAYSQAFSASGGIAPYRYALSSGALPAGMSFSSAGALGGTPTVAGSFSFSVTASDSTGGSAATVTQDYTLAVAAPVIAIAPAALADGVRGSAYSQTLSASGGTAPYSFALGDGALPAGVTLDGAGTLAGTPTVDGSFAFTVVATDALGFTGATGYTLMVTAAPPQVAEDAATTLGATAVTIPVTANDTGAISSIAIDAVPAHGTAAISGLDVVYTPAAGFAGTDSFRYSATGPGGTSAPATVTVTVNPLPVAMSRTLEAVSGIALEVNLAEGATGGPFTAATLVSLAPAGAGTAAIVRSGSGTDARYVLTYTPAAAFSGLATARFTLSNAYATSAEATIDFNVIARPDPSQDAEVLGLLGAQVASTRRFASAQINNFQQRLENMHGGGAQGARFVNGVTFSAAPHCQEQSVGRIPGQRCEHAPLQADVAEAPAAAPARAGGAGSAFGLWTGGVIRSGDSDGRSGRADIDFESDGLSVGADYRVSEDFALGGGIGWGRDDSDISDNGSRSKGKAYTAAVYASYHPGDSVFVDGLVGYQDLSYDLRRYVSANGALVNGTRDGTQWFASISAGADIQRDALQLTPYARLDLARARLDGYVEHGDPIHALRHADMDVDTSTGNVGLRVDYRREASWGMFSPQLRLEYQHDFQGSGAATMSYADLLSGPFYRTGLQTFDRNRVVIGLGVQFGTDTGLSTRIEYRGVVGDGEDSDHGLLLNIEKKY